MHSRKQERTKRALNRHECNMSALVDRKATLDNIISKKQYSDTIVYKSMQDKQKVVADKIGKLTVCIDNTKKNLTNQ